MAAAGAVAAAAALPGGARAGGSRGWAELVGQAIPGIRAAYLRRVEGFTEELRPRFESGELDDYGDENDPGRSDADAQAEARARLEGIVAKRFGLIVRKSTRVPSGGCEIEDLHGDTQAALAILVSSPAVVGAYSERNPDRRGANLAEGWQHPCYAATEAVVVDVLNLADERGWLRHPYSARRAA